MESTRQQARVAGLLYLLGGIIAPFSLLYVPSKLIVPGDASATADRVRASATLLRLGIASEMFVATMFIFVALALYRLFKKVDEYHALSMVALFLVSVPISFFNVLNYVAALILVSGASLLSVFDKPQLDALALLFLRLHGQGIALASVFWGLWLFPFGILVMRSGFIPRVLGIPMFLAGFAYVVTSSTSLVVPQYMHAVSPIASIFYLGELPITLWLLFWGAKQQPSKAAQRNAVIP
jgi:hypothetical protein